MAIRSVSENEVNINGTFFPTIRPVTEIPLNIFPPKRVDGDYTRDSNPRLSSMTWSDFRGGLGLDVMEGNRTDSYWRGDLDTRYQRDVTLGPLITTVNDPTGSTVHGFGDFADDLYVATSGTISEFDGTNWTDRDTLITGGGYTSGVSAQQTDFSFGFVAGTAYLVVADVNTYFYTSDGSTWTDAASGKNTVLTVFWDGRLWGIDNAGQLWFTLSPGSAETDDAQLPVEADEVHSLFIGPDAAGEEIIYAATLGGLWAHDAANTKFIKTRVSFPKSDWNGKTAITWNGDIYVPFGLALYRYSPSNPSALIINVGLNVRDSLHDANENTYYDFLTSDQYGIYAIVTKRGALTNTRRIFFFNGFAWMELPSEVDTVLYTVHTSGSHAEYRVYFGDGSNVNYFDISRSNSKPKQSTNYDYAASGDLKTPWFHADQVDVDKLAVRCKVETADTSTSGTVETVKVEYAIDYLETVSSADDQYKILANATFTDGLIDTDDTGVTTTTFVFPLESSDITVAPVGKVFKAIRFKVSLARGATTTKSPRLVSLTLEHRKKLDFKQGFRVQLDLRKRYKKNSAKDLRSALQTILESNTLVEFTYRNDTGDTRNFYVDTFLQQGLEQTGYNERGTAVVDLLEA